MEAGRLRHMATVWKNLGIEDGRAGVTDEWTEIGKVPVAIQSISIKDRMASGFPILDGLVKLVCRPSGLLAIGRQVVANGHKYEITTLDTDERGRTMIALAKEIF